MIFKEDANRIISAGGLLIPRGDRFAREHSMNLWRALCVALCYKRDRFGLNLSADTFAGYLSLGGVIGLYKEGYREFHEVGEWSHGYVAIRSYLESGGLPGFDCKKLFTGEPQAAAVLEQHAFRMMKLFPMLQRLA